MRGEKPRTARLLDFLSVARACMARWLLCEFLQYAFQPSDCERSGAVFLVWTKRLWPCVSNPAVLQMALIRRICTSISINDRFWPCIRNPEVFEIILVRRIRTRINSRTLVLLAGT